MVFPWVYENTFLSNENVAQAQSCSWAIDRSFDVACGVDGQKPFGSGDS